VAVVLWLVVPQPRPLPRIGFTVPITYQHPADTIKVDPFPTDVDLQVLATKPKLRTLQASDFDVPRLQPAGAHGRRISCCSTRTTSRHRSASSFQQGHPSQFTITYDKRVSRQVPVRVQVSGAPGRGYEVVSTGPASTPADVRVTGPASLLHELSPWRPSPSTSPARRPPSAPSAWRSSLPLRGSPSRRRAR